MQQNSLSAFYQNFLGHSPEWYKLTIIACLVINPILFNIDPYIAGWALVLEFIFTLAMALKCYPLLPGGLLAFEAIAVGMTTPGHVEHEISQNLSVILLLVFMVAGIYFMKDLLMYSFTKLLIKVKSKIALSVAFAAASAFLSAFLDALTVVAVIITVTTGFYTIYHKVASGKHNHVTDHDHTDDEHLDVPTRSDLEEFRAFMRNIMMHAGVGTALGGVCTLVGEPQNLVIAERAGWSFVEFALRMSPITIPVLVFGLLTTVLLEKFKMFNYWAQGVIAIWLIIGLALHLAAVGLIGLSVIILATSIAGITDEHSIGKAFEEALPFTALLCVFFAVVAVIIDQGLFAPVIQWVLTFEGKMQLVMFFIANGLLSMVSDNVFVGTVYINEVAAALQRGIITRDEFDLLAVAINTGTNLPSVATPNGQAAFLFLLTSALAPLIRLSYGKMVYMALPYTIVLSVVGLLATYYGLEDLTQFLYDHHLIEHHATIGQSNITGH